MLSQRLLPRITESGFGWSAGKMEKLHWFFHGLGNHRNVSEFRDSGVTK